MQKQLNFKKSQLAKSCEKKISIFYIFCSVMNFFLLKKKKINMSNCEHCEKLAKQAANYSKKAENCALQIVECCDKNLEKTPSPKQKAQGRPKKASAPKVPRGWTQEENDDYLTNYKDKGTRKDYRTSIDELKNVKARIRKYAR
jgi:hypothetical protein